MALSGLTVELLARWCMETESLANIRSKALGEFLGYSEPGTINYSEDVGDPVSKERRFMGWFSYYFRLSSGHHPAVLAAQSILKESEAKSASIAIEKAMYILGVVSMIIPGKGFYLELQDQEFEISNKYLSGIFYKEETICAHILPSGYKHWVVGPGWVSLPIHCGKGLRANLKQMQMSPVQVERFLQQRPDKQIDPQPEHPRDTTLAEAVNRMTQAAQTAGETKLILSIDVWTGLLIEFMKSEKVTALSEYIVGKLIKHASIEDVNKWLALGSNIWNNAPQPDRGNKSANEIIAEYTETQDKSESSGKPFQAS
jgi:hypothetical protein